MTTYRKRTAVLGMLVVLALLWPVTDAPAQITVREFRQRTWPTERPPRPLPAPQVKFPPYQVRTLANGLQVVAVSHHEQPAVSIRLLVQAGAAQDPADKPGLASLVATLLDQGTTSRSAVEIATTIDSIGGALSTGSASDLTYVNVVVMKDSLTLAAELLADIVRRPAFLQEEIDRQKQQILSGFQVSYEDPGYVAGLLIDRLVYGLSPYGLPRSGTPESVRQITREDLQGFHRTYFTPANTVLAVVGDVTADEAFATVERALGDWPRAEAPETERLSPPDPTRRIVVVDKPDAVQTEIRVGQIGIPRKHPDYMALNLAIKILGGEGSNRLHRVLRSERGLTYGASADLETLRLSGGIVAETNTRSNTTAQALRLMVDEFWKIQRERVGERELADAQAYLTGHFPLTIETPNAIALQILNNLFYGLPLEELETFRERVSAVTVDDIQRVAREYLRPDRLSIVLVGNAAAFADELQSMGFDGFERITLASLDIMAADFRQPGLLAPQPARRSEGASAAPTADEHEAARQILGRAIEAKGGLDRLRGIRTVRATAQTTLHTDRGPVQAQTTTYIGYPDRFRVEAKLPEGEVVQTYAGGQAWLADPSGVHDAPADLREEFRSRASRDLISLLIRAGTGQMALRIGAPEREEGRPLDVVQVSAADLSPLSLVVDRTTGQVVKQRYRSAGPDGMVVTEEVFSDFRSVGGLQIAFKAVVRREGLPVVERVVTGFEINAPLDPGLFRKPTS